MATATKIVLSVSVKNRDGKKVTEKVTMPLKQAENLFSNPKRDSTWKITDDKFTLKNGKITTK